MKRCPKCSAIHERGADCPVCEMNLPIVEKWKSVCESCENHSLSVNGKMACSELKFPESLESGLWRGQKCPLGYHEGEFTAKPSQAKPEKKHRVDPFRNKPGTALLYLIPDFIHVTAGECNCKQYAKQMDWWGIAGCEQRKEEIVEHLVSQKKHLVSPLKSLPETVHRVVARQFVSKALKMAKK